MSIQPAVALAIALIVLAVSNVVLLVALAVRRRRETLPMPLERISNRLDQLERISGSLDDLTRVFLVPHARGGLGETLLNELLHTWLPEGAYETQYRFSDGVRADAVVRIGEYLVSVDAKFPLDQVRPVLEGSGEMPASVRRVFLKHVADIAGKYIKPSEGTLEFALMYLPSEAVYYRAFVEDPGSLMDETVRAGVVPVGPSSLFLYLQTVAFGLRGLGLSRNARELADLIHQLSRDFAGISSTLETTASQLRNAGRNADELLAMSRRFAALLDRLSGAGTGT